MGGASANSNRSLREAAAARRCAAPTSRPTRLAKSRNVASQLRQTSVGGGTHVRPPARRRAVQGSRPIALAVTSVRTLLGGGTRVLPASAAPRRATRGSSSIALVVTSVRTLLGSGTRVLPAAAARRRTAQGSRPIALAVTSVRTSLGGGTRRRATQGSRSIALAETFARTWFGSGWTRVRRWWDARELVQCAWAWHIAQENAASA
ncbi:hypothetical protein VPH35_062243 [Triticum aestivum]